MQKFLLYSSALVVLSGVAEAACIQTPTCSSLGYTSSSACTGGVKCPFGNAWNCTGPNNTTEINNIKNEISSIKTDITNLTNRITNIENNSGSGTGGYSLECLSCSIGNIFYNGTCYDTSSFYSNPQLQDGHYVYAKENGKCLAVSFKNSILKKLSDITDADFKPTASIIQRCSSDNLLANLFNNMSFIAKTGYKTFTFRDGSGTYVDYAVYSTCSISSSYYVISTINRYGVEGVYQEDFEDAYNSYTVYVPKQISF